MGGLQVRTSIEEKREAIYGVSGHVIGGRHANIGEGGLYLIRIPDPGDDFMDILRKTRSRLRAFTFVELAMLSEMTIPLFEQR